MNDILKKQQYDQKRYQEQREKLLTQHRAYYQQNKEKVQIQHQQWLKNNPDYYKKHREHRNRQQNQYRKTLIGYLRGIYANMNQRCNNPNHPRYMDYGGRNIELRFTVNEFIDYVINVLKINPRGLTIDRIDNDGHYEKGNIQFITNSENLQNKRKYYKC